jgi:hypothetical protein
MYIFFALCHTPLAVSIPQDLNIYMKFLASGDGCSPKGDISKEFHGTLQRADL